MKSTYIQTSMVWCTKILNVPIHRRRLFHNDADAFAKQDSKIQHALLVFKFSTKTPCQRDPIPLSQALCLVIIPIQRIYLYGCIQK